MSAPETNRRCLHLVVSARASALRDCLAQRLEGDEVLFIDAGVMHLLADSGAAPIFDEPGFCFSGADLDARGLAPFARQRNVPVLDDRSAARMLRDHPHCLTWK